MGFGFSRDDIGGFVPDYLEKILPADPFQVIDQEGMVGELIRIGIERAARRARTSRSASAASTAASRSRWSSAARSG